MSDSQNVSRRLQIPLLGSASYRPLWVVLGIMALVGGSLLLGPDGLRVLSGTSDQTTASPSEEVRKLPVLVAPAKFVTSVTQNRSYTGIVRTKQKSDLGFELTGRVTDVFVDEGEFVERGKILASLDTRSLKARKSSLKASLDQANAVLQELEFGPRQEKIDSAKAQLVEAKSNLELAKVNLARRQQLGSAIAKEEFDRSKYAKDSAVARVDSISKQLDELLAGTRPEKIKAQKAACDQLESSIAEIDIEIEKSSLCAPFDGKIVKRVIDPGGIVTTSMPVLKIIDFKNLEAVIGVPVAIAQRLDEDADYELIVGGHKYTARLMAKIQQLELSTRTQNLIFKLSDYAAEKVIPGELCQIEIPTEIQSDGFWIPRTSLTNGIRGLWSLLIVDSASSRIKKADVQIKYTDGKLALVAGPISAGDLVVIDGTHRIVSDQLVEPVLESKGRPNDE